MTPKKYQLHPVLIPLIFLGLGFLWSCKQEAIIPTGPTISFASGLGVTDKDGIHSPNQQIYIKFIANRAASHLEAIRVYVNNRLYPEYGSGGLKLVPKTGKSFYRDSLSLNLPDSLGQQIVKIEVIDVDGNKGYGILNLITQDPVESLDTLILYSRFNLTDTFDGHRRGQFIQINTGRIFDSITAVNNPFFPDLGFEAFQNGLAKIFSPEASANLVGAYPVPGGKPVFIDSVSVNKWDVSPRGMANLPTPTAQTKVLVQDSVYYFTDRRKVRGLIKVSELVASPQSSGRILAFVRWQNIP